MSERQNYERPKCEIVGCNAPATIGWQRIVEAIDEQGRVYYPVGASGWVCDEHLQTIGIKTGRIDRREEQP